jgi:predicted DsbA family dithiol-disulfide isomerase
MRSGRQLSSHLTQTAITAACALLSGVAASVLSARTLSAAPQTTAPPGGAAIATIGSERITEADIIGKDPEAFENLQASYDLKIRQLQLSRAQDRYTLLKQRTERLLDQRALALEAQSRGTTGEAVLADIKVDAVTEADARAYYEANKGRTTQSFEQLQTEITQYLASQHNARATRHFYDELRVKHHISSLLQPYRLPFATTGPARGTAGAAITVVEFADFQCPYCRQAQDTLHAIMAKYPQDVRLVFRELPLTSVHPNALGAARAAVCADRQGMFWPMHDAMYGDQNALGDTALRDTAKRIGLDMEAFAACLSAKATTDVITADMKTADELNIGTTPFFLVNGRPIKGSVSVEEFDSVVSDELKIVAKRG